MTKLETILDFAADIFEMAVPLAFLAGAAYGVMTLLNTLASLPY